MMVCDSRCKHYVYVDISAYPIAHGEDGWTSEDKGDLAPLYPDDSITSELGTTNMAYLNEDQVRVAVILFCATNGTFLLDYRNIECNEQGILGLISIKCLSKQSTTIIELDERCVLGSICVEWLSRPGQ